MEFTGRVWKFKNDINTDEIIPARYLNTSDPDELARHCMEDVDPAFPDKVKSGDIIVAGSNFGCGSSREHAPISIKASGVACVIAKSFARIFFRNAYNMGLPILECQELGDTVSEGDILQVRLDEGKIIDKKTGAVFSAQPVPEFMQRLIAEGGLMNYVKKKTEEVVLYA